jgi:radical SAM protein with 4Fe4S-binding SPASM domain
VQYQELIDRLKNYIFMVSLYDIGEPLENEDVIEYIKYAHMKKVGTVISSSLSINKTDEFWKELVLSGIDHIVVAIDGTSEEVYKKYKTNGNLNLVLSNLEKILYYKAMYAKKVFIEWQMIDLPWNKEEQGTAKKMAGDMGCDKFRLITEAMWSRLKYRQQRYIRNHNCLLPYIIFIVTAYNKVRPCYKIYNEDMIVGDLDDHTFDEIWNSDEIATIRDKKRIRDRIGCKTCRE